MSDKDADTERPITPVQNGEGKSEMSRPFTPIRINTNRPFTPLSQTDSPPTPDSPGSKPSTPSQPRTTDELLDHYRDKYESNEVLHRIVDDKQQDVMMKAIESGEYDMEGRDDQNRTPLILSIMNGNYPMMKLLVENGADVNCHQMFGWRPIHITAYEGENENMLSIMKLLLDKGCDINQTQMTPLHLAAIRENSDMTYLLLERGAKRFKKSAKGQTPIEVCTNASLRKLIRKFLEIQKQKEEEEEKKKKEMKMKRMLKKRMRKKKRAAKKLRDTQSTSMSSTNRSTLSSTQ